MDQTAIESYLTRIRAAGDAELRPCKLVTSEVVISPAFKVGVAHLFLRPRFLLADPTGCGKTPQSIVAYGYLREKDPTYRLLVITKKSAQFQWKTSVERFLQKTSAVVLGFDDKKNRLPPGARLASYAKLTAPVIITTYETLARDQEQLLPALENFGVVFDEVQKVNNFRTHQAALKAEDDRLTLYGAAARASHKARTAWALSATPMTNDRIDELYSVLELIRPGTFGPYAQFRRSYYILRLVKPRWKMKGGGAAKPFYEIVGLQNQDHLRAVIDPFYLRRHDNAFDQSRPPITYRYEDIFLPTQQQKVYDQTWEGNWPGSDTKLKKITAILRCQQVLAAPELMGFPKIGHAKLDRLLELLKGDFQDSKVLVYTKFATVAGWLSRQLTANKISHGLITGDTPAGAREATRKAFQTTPTTRVMVLTDAGGEALDLQTASVVLFYDLPWSHGNFQQVVGRARRIGSQHPNVLVSLLVANNTIDAFILKTLQRKEATIRATLTQGNNSPDTANNATLNLNHTDHLLNSINIPADTDLETLFREITHR